MTQQLSMTLSYPTSDAGLSSAPNGALVIRDAMGHYVAASDEEILIAAHRVIDRKLTRGLMISSPETIKKYLVTKLAAEEHELFLALFVDSQHQLIDCVELFRGTIDGAAVYPREVVKAALKCNAAAVFFSHNHPSGLPEPSAADRALTTRLVEALRLVEIRVLDHIVVGGTRTVSFAERGWI